ncbi:MAG: AAA domain-containing protein [Lachnospiraceae bacterium]|nr:AAA domain-containing protein [Lachnospiraceae bacterium]
MTQQEKELFKKLTDDRTENAAVLEKTSMKGVKKSVVEKYSDQAHFIYELIQNADDVGANEARFELYKDRLVFIHNGTRLFTVTDLDNEEEDTKNGNLGDLNAITSIANSNKTSASIGKFGVGFKAVFQYTTTPYIYDPQIAFKIERFIVPEIIMDDFSGRKKNETAFVFPFDHPDRKADEAFEDILHKLQNLVFPTLFLKNLRKITFKCGEVTGEYIKKVKEERVIDDTKIEKLEFVNGKKGSSDRMWLFTRKTEEQYRYSCGFFVDKAGKLMNTDYYAFCFFPTKKDTNLNFIINAPFLLTDSREGIKATDKHNIRMIELLAELSADCFVYLRDIGIENDIQIIDDEILSFIPIDESLYIPKNPRDDISLFPFYKEINRVFSEEAMFPSFDDYVYAENAYMAYWSLISDLISNEQLSALVKNDNAEWILPTKGYETLYRARDGKAEYITGIIDNKPVQDLNIIDMLTPEFILAQSKEWLLKLYDFLLETDRRIDKCKTAPIFISKSGKAVAAYDKVGDAILFIDDEDSKGYNTIDAEYLKYDSVKKLVERLGIKKPELKDKITNKILKKEVLNPKSDFKAFLQYYIELLEADEDTYDLINSIEERSFILAKSEDGIDSVTCSASEVYLPSEELRKYFEGCGTNIYFVDVEEYRNYLSKKDGRYLDEFLGALGVKTKVGVMRYEYNLDEVAEEYGRNWPQATQYKHWYDYMPDEMDRVLDRIIDNNDRELSMILWNQLVSIFATQTGYISRPIIGGVYDYFYFSDRYQSYEGFSVKWLRSKKWIFNRNEQLRSANEISIQDLGNGYDTFSPAAKKLLSFLRIQDEHPEYEELDDAVRQKVEAYDSLAGMGIFDLSPEKMEQLMLLLKEQSNSSSNSDKTDAVLPVEEESEEEKIIKDIQERVKKKKEKTTADDKTKDVPDKEQEPDDDEMTKASVNFTKKIEQAMQKCEDEVSRLAQEKEAHEKAESSEKYSYGWFSAMLQLEAMANGDDNANSREVSICFSAVEKEQGTNRTLILKHPDKNIPQVMEELVDIPLDLTFFDGQTKRLIIEVANVQSYTLRVKVKQDDFLFYGDFESITQAKIVAQSPTFLTRELQKEFARFGHDPYNFDDSYDMQENLCENIQFIFGPPGTGKTTYLAKETLIPLIKKEKKAKIIVLTPTNKAADVLVSRIMQIMGDDTSYEDWLIRYGVTGDEDIEKSKVFHGKDFEIEDYKKCVIVTTMARFPYDYFIDSTGKFNNLHGINWDYIVVDEASMIPLVQMVYALYLKTPKKFILAGDPFQIEPTTAVSEWKSENIYKLVHLEEFSEDADTVPHKYEIKLLTKQYRSIESIGEVFSQLTYGGVLEHARENEDARPLNIERFLNYEHLNIIKFPVSKFESIYRAKRLKLSSYQVYSALFTYEFTEYLSKSLARSNPSSETFRIGVIAPYGAQAGLIDKLVMAADIPENIEVNCGTIHGFQGDECDIVIALFNPPPHISTNKEMFLNRQNIINVAISRARDYLFVLSPDDETENVENLWLINRLTRIIEKDFHSEQSAKDLEELLFDNRDYLEENAFSTGHQIVNVYGLPEKRYEIRSEDSALDVQVHGKVYYAPFVVADEEDRPLTLEELKELVLGKSVIHKSYGNGVVAEIDDGIVEIDFAGKPHKFQFPSVFTGFVRAEDEEIQQRILQTIETM